MSQVTTLDLNALFCEMSPLLRGYFRRRVSSPNDADDLAATVWLKVVTAAPRYRDHGTPRAWVWQIARNVLYDHLRRCSLPCTPLPDTDHAGPSALDRTLEHLPLYDALDHLRPDQRTLLCGWYAGGWDQYEAARILGTTVNGVKKRKLRAVAALRRLLEVA